MTLQAFSFPLPETRFIKAGNFIYKFKIRRGSSHSVDDFTGGSCFSGELEEIIRTVLQNLDGLRPFSSPRLTVYPYKKPWDGASEELCSCCQGDLRAYTFMIVLQLESNKQNEKRAEEKLSPEEEEVAHRIPCVSELQPKRRKQDSPLEGAIIKDSIQDFEAETDVSVVRLHVNNPHAEDEVKEAPGHADEKRTKGFNEPQEESGVDLVRRAPSEVHPGTHQDLSDDEEGSEDGENADSAPETPEEPGMLTRLASRIFPLSLFIRNT